MGQRAVKSRQPGSGLAAVAHTNPTASMHILTQMTPFTPVSFSQLIIGFIEKEPLYRGYSRRRCFDNS
jgi:hypothetical protein